MAQGRGNDRKGSPVPKKNGGALRVVGPGGDSVALGKARNAGEFGVGAGYGPPGSDKPKGRLY